MIVFVYASVFVRSHVSAWHIHYFNCITRWETIIRTTTKQDMKAVGGMETNQQDPLLPFKCDRHLSHSLSLFRTHTHTHTYFFTHVSVVHRSVYIDFWTTRCTQCPAALDKLDSLAASSDSTATTPISFVSICCDKLDGAREIIERENELKWSHIHHYFMSHEDKEKAKILLGFASVPFYVVVEPDGETIIVSGNKVDLPSVLKEPETSVNPPGETESVLVIDDLDF